MPKLLMITGLGSVKDLVSDKRGAFYNTLEEFHRYWDRIDIISPKIKGHASGVKNIFGNIYIHISSWPLVLYPFWFLKKGYEIYREQKFDLMTVQEFPPFYNGIGARLLWQKIKVPYVLEIHHIPGYPRAASIKERIYLIMTRLFVGFDSNKAKAVRVVNEKEVPEFLIKSGVPKEKICYVPSLYIDFNIFKKTDTQKEYDIIFVGRLEKNKGLDIFLKTVHELKRREHNIKAIVIGTGPLKEYCDEKIKEYKLEHNVLMHGWANSQHEIAELINRSKILLMTSYNEGGPRVVVESLACGVPVIGTPVGIVEKIVGEGKAGFVVDWNVGDICEKILKLMSDPDLYQEFSQNGLQIAVEFEKQKTIKKYADFLYEIRL